MSSTNGNGRRDPLAPSEPRNEPQAERELTGHPFTLDYRPSRVGISGYGYGDDDRFDYWRVLHDVERMAPHPDVMQPTGYYKAGIFSVKFKVKARNTAEAQEAHATLSRFWERSLEDAQLTYDFGWGCFEPLYRERKALLEFEGMLPLHPLDCTALVRDGGFVGATVQGSVSAMPQRRTGQHARDGGAIRLRAAGRYPGKVLWLTHNRRWDRFYGRSQYTGAWRPWLRLAQRDGAEEIIDGAIYRRGYAGPTVRYPSCDYRRAGSGEMDMEAARGDARQMSEQIKAGWSAAFPSDRDDKGNFYWDIEWPDTSLANLSGLLEYEGGLQKQISRGIGVPPELLEAAETGSGWSGRKVPLLGFFQGQQQNARRLVRAIVGQIVEPLLRWNHGPEAWCEVEVELDLPSAVSGEQPQQQQPAGPQEQPQPGAEAQPEQPAEQQAGGLESLLPTGGAQLSREAEPKKYACALFRLPPSLSARVLRMAGEIADGDLAEDGREDKPHVTARYGLEIDSPDPLRSLLAGVGTVSVRLGKTSIFPASESGEADVVKIDVESDSLHTLYKLLGALPHHDTHPTYQPHVTIAYVKPGKGEKYAGLDDLDGETATLEALTFSDREGEKTELRLEGGRDLRDAAYLLCRRRLRESREGVRLSAEWDEKKYVRDHGKFASKPGDSATKEKKPHVNRGRKPLPRQQKRSAMAKLKAAATGGADAFKHVGHGAKHVEHVVQDFLANGVDERLSKLPPVKGAICKGLWWLTKLGTKVAFATYLAGQSAAEAVAREGGATPEQSAKLRGICTALDLAGAKAVPLTLTAIGLGSLGVAASFIPAGSAAYLAYSSARRPLAVLRAAGKAIIRALKRKGSPAEAATAALSLAPGVDRSLALLLERLKTHEGDGDWYEALVYAALEHAKDLDEAIALADDAVSHDAEADEAEERELSATWDESEHPRDHGKFAKKGGGAAVAERPEPHKHEIELDDREAVEEVWSVLFGDEATTDEAGSLVGAPDGATVVVSRTGPRELLIKTDHPDYESERHVRYDRRLGGAYIQNDFQGLKDRSKRGGGLGAKVVEAQVEACRKAGVKALRCHAAGDIDTNLDEGLNGYAVWPKFGYDQPIEELPDYLFTRAQRAFPDAESVLDIIDAPRAIVSPQDREKVLRRLDKLDAKLGRAKKERPEITGEDWWTAFGENLEDAEFDLRDGSRSLKRYEAYMEKKKAAGKSLALPEEGNVHPRGEPVRCEEPDFSPADLQALDEVCEDMRKAAEKGEEE